MCVDCVLHGNVLIKIDFSRCCPTCYVAPCDLCVLNCAPDFFAGGAAEFWGQCFNGGNEIWHILIVVIEFMELRR